MNTQLVTLPAGAKHTHGGKTFYGPCQIELPEDEAQWLAESVINARIEKREKAKRLPLTPEAKEAQADTKMDMKE